MDQIAPFPGVIKFSREGHCPYILQATALRNGTFETSISVTLWSLDAEDFITLPTWSVMSSRPNDSCQLWTQRIAQRKLTLSDSLSPNQKLHIAYG